MTQSFKSLSNSCGLLEDGGECRLCDTNAFLHFLIDNPQTRRLLRQQRCPLQILSATAVAVFYDIPSSLLGSTARREGTRFHVAGNGPSFLDRRDHDLTGTVLCCWAATSRQASRSVMRQRNGPFK